MVSWLEFIILTAIRQWPSEWDKNEFIQTQITNLIEGVAGQSNLSAMVDFLSMKVMYRLSG